MPTTLPWGLLCALLPLPALAQQAPRSYVGASATLLSFAPFEPYADTHVGPAVTVGLQLGKRWAVETGAQLTWHQEVNNDFSVAFPPTYVPQPLTITAHYTTLVVPLLARYTFTAPQSRLRVDALGGASWVHGATRVQYTGQAGQAVTDDSRYSSNTAAVVLGPQLRYALSPALEVKLNAPLNFAVLGNSEGSFRERLLLSPQLGVQYAFAR